MNSKYNNSDSKLDKVRDGRGDYLKGQPGACSPRQPQWQHWGALRLTVSEDAGVVRVDAGMDADGCWVEARVTWVACMVAKSMGEGEKL